jgi:hypothetical protein
MQDAAGRTGTDQEVIARTQWLIGRLHGHNHARPDTGRHGGRPGPQVEMQHSPDADTVDMCWPIVNANLNDLVATRPEATGRRETQRP